MENLLAAVGGLAGERLPQPALRAFGAGATALVLTLLLVPIYLQVLRRLHVVDRGEKGDSERLDQLHASKRSTPTMGGVVPLAAMGAASLLWCKQTFPHVWIVLVGGLAAALVGMWDDVTKLRRSGHGLWPREKLLLLFSIGLGAGLLCTGELPSFKEHWLPFFLIPVWVSFVVTGTANAVNLTDGLDGLASGCLALAAAGLSVGAAVYGSVGGASAQAAQGADISVVCAALAGCSVGFLFFNAHPASIFMGDTGSLGLGTVLALSAVIARLEFVLLLLGGVFVAEALSVLLQVLSFRLWRKRIFLIAPLHHHFEFKGWPETVVTLRFWLAGALLTLVFVVVFL